MAGFSNGVQTVGTDDTPIALGASGGATDVWTWNHNKGKRAVKIDCLRAYDRQNYLLTAVMRVTWEDLSQATCSADRRRQLTQGRLGLSPRFFFPWRA